MVDLKPIEIDDELWSKQTPEEAEFEDRPFAAGAAGLARDFTLGLSDVLLTEAGIVDPETLEGLRKYNPGATAIGEIAGIIAPGGAISKVGKGVKALKGGIAAKAIVEGAAMGLQHSITEDALGDPDMNAQAYLTNVGLGAVLGGGVGTLARVGDSAFTKFTISQFKKVAKGEGNLFEKMVERQLNALDDDAVKAFEQTVKPPIVGAPMGTGTAKLTTEELRELVGGKIKDEFSRALQDLESGAMTASTMNKLKNKMFIGHVASALEFGAGAAVGNAFEMPVLGALVGGNKRLINEVLKKVVPVSSIGKLIGMKGFTHVSDTAAKVVLGILPSSANVSKVTLSSLKLLSEAPEGETRQQALTRLASDIDNLVANPALIDERVDPSFQQLASVAPKSAIAMKDRVQRDLMWLQGRLPRSSPRSPIAKQLPSIPKTELDGFETRVRALFQPKEALEDVAAGRAGKEMIQAIEETRPLLVTMLRRSIMEGLIGVEDLSYEIRKRLQVIMGGGMDPSYDPIVIKRLQARAEEGEGPEGPTPKRGRNVDIASSEMSRAGELER